MLTNRSPIGLVPYPNIGISIGFLGAIGGRNSDEMVIASKLRHQDSDIFLGYHVSS